MIKKSLLQRNISWNYYLRLLIAAGATFSPLTLIFFVYAQVFILIKNLIIQTSKLLSQRYAILGVVFFLASLDVLSRAASTSPYIPHEFSKYLLTFFLLFVGLKAYYGKTNVEGLILLLLFVLPTIIAFGKDMLTITGFVNSALGLINFALGIWVLKGKKIMQFDFIYILRLLLFSTLMLLVFVRIRTPEYDEIVFDLGANSAASGGFGSNQVSTVLGLGMFLCGISFIKGYRLSGHPILDGVLFFAFLFQGLLTLSRGGILVGAISLSVFLILQFGHLKASMRSKILTGIFVFTIGSIVVFSIADTITKGTLFLRYQGETTGTIVGAKERDLNTITSGRYFIMLEDLNLWVASTTNFILGVGFGVSQEIRGGGLQGVSAHVEMSRILAEQGILGLVMIIYILWVGFRLLKKRSDFSDLQFALFVLAILTSFHAAMRTFVTPVLLTLCVLDEYQFPVNSKVRKTYFN